MCTSTIPCTVQCTSVWCGGCCEHQLYPVLYSVPACGVEDVVYINYILYCTMYQCVVWRMLCTSTISCTVQCTSVWCGGCCVHQPYPVLYSVPLCGVEDVAYINYTLYCTVYQCVVWRMLCTSTIPCTVQCTSVWCGGCCVHQLYPGLRPPHWPLQPAVLPQVKLGFLMKNFVITGNNAKFANQAKQKKFECRKVHATYDLDDVNSFLERDSYFNTFAEFAFNLRGGSLSRLITLNYF